MKSWKITYKFIDHTRKRIVMICFFITATQTVTWAESQGADRPGYLKWMQHYGQFQLKIWQELEGLIAKRYARHLVPEGQQLAPDLKPYQSLKKHIKEDSVTVSRSDRQPRLVQETDAFADCKLKYELGKKEANSDWRGMFDYDQMCWQEVYEIHFQAGADPEYSGPNVNFQLRAKQPEAGDAFAFVNETSNPQTGGASVHDKYKAKYLHLRQQYADLARKYRESGSRDYGMY